MHIKSLEHLPVQHSHFVWLVWNYSCWANIHHSLVWHYFWNTSNRFLGKFSLISARILLLLIWHQILSSICQVWFDFSFPFYLSIFSFSVTSTLLFWLQLLFFSLRVSGDRRCCDGEDPLPCSLLLALAQAAKESQVEISTTAVPSLVKLAFH